MRRIGGLLAFIVVMTVVSGLVMSLLFTGIARMVAYAMVLGIGLLSTIIVLLDLVY